VSATRWGAVLGGVIQGSSCGRGGGDGGTGSGRAAEARGSASWTAARHSRAGSGEGGSDPSSTEPPCAARIGRGRRRPHPAWVRRGAWPPPPSARRARRESPEPVGILVSRACIVRAVKRPMPPDVRAYRVQTPIPQGAIRGDAISSSLGHERGGGGALYLSTRSGSSCPFPCTELGTGHHARAPRHPLHGLHHVHDGTLMICKWSKKANFTHQISDYRTDARGTFCRAARAPWFLRPQRRKAIVFLQAREIDPRV